MAAPAPFTQHVFISYSHIDNERIAPAQEGWVSRFHASLEPMLSMRLGCKAAIWRDEKISGSDIFADKIVAQFPSTAVLISILTPRYVKSEWCRREVREFYETAERTGSLAIGHKSRLVKVIKTPVEDIGELARLIDGTRGYEFYVVDEGAPIELDAAYGPEMAQKFMFAISKLSYHLAQTLKALAAAPPAATAAATPAAAPPVTKPTVFLATCGHDLRGTRDAIEMDLTVSGYTVVPNGDLPTEETAHIAAVNELLASCQLSIHLVGSAYGVVPDGSSGKSVVVLQNELAAQASRDRGLARVIWIPDGTTAVNPQQKEFIEGLHSSAALQFGADLVTTDLETVKSCAHAALARIEADAARPSPDVADAPATVAPSVYLICDERDSADTFPLRRLLQSRGIDVEIPVFEGPAAVVRQANEDLLRGCAAAMVFYGAGEKAWRLSVKTDLQRAPSLRGARPLPAVYTYLAGPSTRDKNELLALQPNVIDGMEGLVESAVKPFIASLTAQR